MYQRSTFREEESGILVNIGESNHISKERFKCQVSSWRTHHKCQVINKRWKGDNSPAKSRFLILLANYKFFITDKFLKNRIEHLHYLSTSSQHLTGCSGYKQWETQHALWPTHSLPTLRRWMDRAMVGSPRPYLAWLWRWSKAPVSNPWCFID